MKNNEINIRDPFVVCENGVYYMYGTRAENFGVKTGGFDVYIGTDLENWSLPKEVFNSEKYLLNREVNWAPEVHKFGDKYYMLATFTQNNGLRGTYALVSNTPDGAFAPVSEKPLTPPAWCCLDGTLYVDRAGAPYLVFCHEHVQIKNGTVCAVRLLPDLSAADGEPFYLFSGSHAYGMQPSPNGGYVTDGPFLYRGKKDKLYMIWSTIVNGAYYQCLAVSDNGEINGNWVQLRPIFTADGGHGMVFRNLTGGLCLVLHAPNISEREHPVFFALRDTGKTLRILK
ncbi:MAG: family 43 glycosylhydrolase [Clostridia bacterium]|nr:family 43 glycosylhydrolase [Clostridia bacterium]